MLTKSYADAASPTTETLDGHGFTQVKASKSPGRKKGTNTDKTKPTATKNPFEALSDNEDEPATDYMEVDTVPHVTPAKAAKKKKPAKKSQAQVMAALMEKAKARAAAQARQIDALSDHPGAAPAPLARKNTGCQQGGTKGSVSHAQDTTGGEPMEEEHDATPCANCLEICGNRRVTDHATDLIYCSMSCMMEHWRNKAILDQGKGRKDGDDSDEEVEIFRICELGTIGDRRLAKRNRRQRRGRIGGGRGI